jgi:hypothetical protein
MNRQDILISAAAEWLEAQSGHQLAHELVFDDQWHYIDRAGKHGYIGQWHQDKYGARLKLTYNTFKGGGYTATFDDFAALRSAHDRTRSYKRRNLPKAKPKEDTTKRDIETWHKLPRSGSSTYLKNKRVDDVNTPSIRYRGRDGWALVVGLGTGGTLEHRGVQKLLASPLDNGVNKLFSSKLQTKGAFIVVGDFDSLTSKGAFICEGLATALTVYKATGRLTLAALNADNLEHVVASLRSSYPNALLTIVADNDAWRKKGNIGIQKATAAAQTHTARLVVPNFEGCDLTSKPTDINDLYQLAGFETVKKQLEGARYVDPSPFETMQGVTYERVHDFGDVKLERGATLFKGFQGVGKTEAGTREIAAITAADPTTSITATCHRVSLTRKLTNDVTRAGVSGMAFYQDDDFDTASPRKGICSHSLFKLLRQIENKERYAMPDVVFADEIQQILRDLVDGIIDYKPAVWAAFCEIIKNARYFIGLDADISPSTVRFIQRCRTGEPVRIVEATHSPWQGREVRVYDDKERFLNRYSNDLNAGKKVLYGTNAKKRARKMQALCKERGLKTLALHSDSSGGDAQQDFIGNASVESMKYQVLIYSPSVGTGVSIDNDHYDVVYLDFADWLTSADCVQIALRYRRNVPMHVYIDSGSRYPETDPAKIKQAFLDAPTHDSALIRWDGGQRGILNDDYEALYLDVKTEDAHDILNFKANIVKRFVDLGMNVAFDGRKLDADFNGYLRDLEHNLHADALEGAADVDHRTAAALEQQDVKGEDDSIRLERYRYRDALRLPPAAMFEATSTAIRHAFDVDLLPKLSAWRTALVDDETLLERAAKNAQGHEAMFRADLHQHGALQGLTRERYRQALQAAGADVDGLFKQWQFKQTYPATAFDTNDLTPLLTTSYTKHSPAVQQWALWAQQQPWLELPDDFDKNPIQHLNDTLRSLGLTITSKQQRRKTLKTAYINELVTPLQQGAMLTAVRTKTGRVKRYDLTYQDTTSKADTRKVKRLLEHGALHQQPDDTLTLDLETLRTRFNFEGNEGRVYLYEITGCDALLWLFDPRGMAENLPLKKCKDVTPPLLIKKEHPCDNFAFLADDPTNKVEPPKTPEPVKVPNETETPATADDATELVTLTTVEAAINRYRTLLNLVPLRFKNTTEIKQSLPYYAEHVPIARALLERMQT